MNDADVDLVDRERRDSNKLEFFLEVLALTPGVLHSINIA